jgi:hypothetical protein
MGQFAKTPREMEIRLTSLIMHGKIKPMYYEFAYGEAKGYLRELKNQPGKTGKISYLKAYAYGRWKTGTDSALLRHAPKKRKLLLEAKKVIKRYDHSAKSIIPIIDKHISEIDECTEFIFPRLNPYSDPIKKSWFGFFRQGITLDENKKRIDNYKKRLENTRKELEIKKKAMEKHNVWVKEREQAYHTKHDAQIKKAREEPRQQGNLVPGSPEYNLGRDGISQPKKPYGLLDKVFELRKAQQSPDVQPIRHNLGREVVDSSSERPSHVKYNFGGPIAQKSRTPHASKLTSFEEANRIRKVLDDYREENKDPLAFMKEFRHTQSDPNTELIRDFRSEIGNLNSEMRKIREAQDEMATTTPPNRDGVFFVTGPGANKTIKELEETGDFVQMTPGEHFDYKYHGRIPQSVFDRARDQRRYNRGW